jgi:serine/threonine protein kinase
MDNDAGYLGEGTFGCVFRAPPTPVCREAENKLGQRSKIAKFVLEKDAEAEMNTYGLVSSRLKKVDPDMSRTIHSPIQCEYNADTYDDLLLSHCTNARIKQQVNRSRRRKGAPASSRSNSKSQSRSRTKSQSGQRKRGDDDDELWFMNSRSRSSSRRSDNEDPLSVLVYVNGGESVLSYVVKKGLSEDNRVARVLELLQVTVPSILKTIFILNSEGLYHNDLSLANIVIDPVSKLSRIIDFGLAFTSDISREEFIERFTTHTYTPVMAPIMAAEEDQCIKYTEFVYKLLYAPEFKKYMDMGLDSMSDVKDMIIDGHVSVWREEKAFSKGASIERLARFVDVQFFSYNLLRMLSLSLPVLQHMKGHFPDLVRAIIRFVLHALMLRFDYTAAPEVYRRTVLNKLQ